MSIKKRFNMSNLTDQLVDNAQFITVGGGGTMFIGGISASTIVAIIGGISVVIGLALQLVRSFRDKERRAEERELHIIEMKIKIKQLAESK